MNERDYLTRVGVQGDRMRVRFTTERGRVLRYSVQFEVLHQDHYWPAVRYDSAHGAPHRDTLGWQGETIKKIWFHSMSFEDGFTDAQQQVREQWLWLRQAFLEREP